ncbi:MAG: hypothetical protein Q9217_003061 [Psora testacea]
MDSSWNPALRPNSDRVIDDSVKPLAPCKAVNELATKDDNSIAQESDVFTGQRSLQQRPDLPAKGVNGRVNTVQLHGSHEDLFEPLAYPGILVRGKALDGKLRVSRGGVSEGNGVTTVPELETSNVKITVADEGTKLRDEAELSSTAGLQQNPASKRFLNEKEYTNLPLGGKDEIYQAFAAEAQNGDQVPFQNPNQTDLFPEVPPLSQTTVLLPHPLPTSQAENIMEEEEHTELAQASAATITSGTDNKARWNPSFAENMGEEDENIFPSVGGVQLRPHFPSQENEQARFDEGLPLVQLATKQKKSFSKSGMADASHSTPPQEDDDEGFFDKSESPTDESSAFKPQPLDRKTTAQVLGSLGYAPRPDRDTEPEAQEQTQSLDDLTREGIAASEETVKAQFLAEKQLEKAESEAKDEDLAEQWKAALGDDDLLEENDPSVDPSSFFEDDGEGFLEDDPDDNGRAALSPEASLVPPFQPVDSVNEKSQGLSKSDTRSPKFSDAYMPTSTSSTQQGGASSYYPSRLQRTHGSSGSPHPPAAPSGFAGRPRQQVPSADNSALSRPSIQESAQSFADKAKGGYTSPYDLPMEVTRPRKRAQLPPARLSSEAQTSSSQPRPPRSTSMYSGAPPAQEPQPRIPSLPRPGPSTSAGVAVSSALKARSSSSSFFEELPSSKPGSSSVGRGIRPAFQPTPPPPLPAPRLPNKQSPYEQHTPANTQTYQLLPPEKINPYGDSTAQQPARQAVPVINPRYSPAPSQTSTVPPSVNRYASSPMGGPRPASTQALPHQPRTSSPLTQNSTIASQLPPDASGPSPAMQISSRKYETSSPPKTIPPRFPFPDTHQARSIGELDLGRVDENARSQFRPHISESPPLVFPPNAARRSSSPSASSHAIYTPGPDRSSPDESAVFQDRQAHDLNGFVRGPPKRSQTQSPGAQNPSGPPAMPTAPYQRPASDNGYAPSASLRETLSASIQAERPIQEQAHMINYIKPTDGREIDNLERWKGCPIISFGFGGTIVKTFPQHVPRYAAGQKIPMIKCSPGEVKIEKNRTFALDEWIATFPGSLKMKGKKKEVLDWLQKKVHALESSGNHVKRNNHTLPDPDKCHEERVLLWNVVKILVDYDGVIEGNVAAEKAVRALLSPELGQDDAAPVQSSSNASLLGITRRGGSISIPSLVRPETMEQLRKALLHGEREQAVWHAVDSRLWAHAMLLSSTLDKSIWKQVAQEFVRQEVKTFGENTEALCALFQIFAGNWEECVDELVPPSARVGLQMVSKISNTGPTKNALDSLDRWRETLTLILSNRTADDRTALVALGQLLASYGRTEAAHICYIFAKTPGLFGGPDDPKVSVVLLGADHLRYPSDYGRDFESILLTEVYEFARTVLSSSSVSTVSPHLQSYKLYHAMTLAEYGYKTEAQQYCDTIFSTMKSTTKPSSYYHRLLIGVLEDLQDRLRQAPRDSSGSWISKPSIDKVSGSIWAKFNSYVAGEEDDTGSTGSGKAHEPAAGPFARVTGDSPTLSRTPSSSELYNTYSSGVGLAQAAPTANSRYAPAGLYTPRSSLDKPRRSSQDHSKPSTNDTLRPALATQQYSLQPASSVGSNYEPYVPPPQPSSYPPRSQSYLPNPPSQSEVLPRASSEEPQSSLYQQEAHRPTHPWEQRPQPEYRPEFDYDQKTSSPEPSSSSYEPPTASYEPPTSLYQPSTSSYEPPSGSGYEAPSYNPPSSDPEEPEPNAALMDQKPNKSFMDLEDEDDFEARATALRREEKARKDREADEAFQKAAEADAQKDKVPKLNNKKSWFGPWFSGSKDKSNASNPNTPIKVKLGEENSFYYDQQLKKWVNKKGTNTEASAAPVEPPPRGPPSRSVSAAAGLPPSSTPIPPVPPLPAGMGPSKPPTRVMSGPTSSSHLISDSPSRTASPVAQEPSGEESAPPSGVAVPEPPSRPATGQSGASSIDDLIGVPQARKVGTVRKGKKGRGYVDVMAK